MDALFADTKEKWGSIDVLVNNAAGMALKDGRVDEISLEDWDAVFASDVRSTFYCTKTVLPFMQEQGAGSIINIGSMDDVDRADVYRNQMEGLLAAGGAMADEVYADVVKRLS